MVEGRPVTEPPGIVADFAHGGFYQAAEGAAIARRDGSYRFVTGRVEDTAKGAPSPVQIGVIRSAIDEQRQVEIEYSSGNGWRSLLATPIATDEAVVVIRDVTAAVEERLALRRQAEEATGELGVMIDVSSSMAMHFDLRPLLELIIQQVQSVVDYARSSIYLLEGETLFLLASRSSRDGVAGPPASYHMPAVSLGPLWQQVSQQKPVLIRDLHTDIEIVGPLRQSLGPVFTSAVQNIHSQLVVPLAIKERVLGMITLSHEGAGFYNDHHARLMVAVGTQAAIAIENARLFERASQVAAIEERQRLARELHDSVSQALYGIALGARTARTMLDRDPAGAVEPVEYVLSLAEAGQAEMRALIFELRPESLEREGLVSALQKQVDAVSARYGIAIEATFDEEPAVSLQEKEVFYRIGQEAMHNVVKHAHAARISLSLIDDDHGLTLQVRDNGIGFEASESFPGHMGLVSMAERAASVGAGIVVESSPGKGTTVTLQLVRQPIG